MISRSFSLGMFSLTGVGMVCILLYPVLKGKDKTTSACARTEPRRSIAKQAINSGATKAIYGCNREIVPIPQEGYQEDSVVVAVVSWYRLSHASPFLPG